MFNFRECCASGPRVLPVLALHGVSKGVYLLDPDGIAIEITYEVPLARWPGTPTPSSAPSG